ncbi:glycoside hydrolase family 32 protein [Halobacillus sp. Marseille-Q1614]|uniref:glycoside hydrolase family 32 protein n=1 Tax=Halobacillus sp. Marseille-Q1614 TaxID=2709134 RepID=UPI00156E12BD|nr:glycoside hydrolase family 32 protein [Halobacillus sp. Marseille-Q1614]
MKKKLTKKSLLWTLIVLSSLFLLTLGVLWINQPEEQEEEPSIDKTHRADYHFTAPDHWKNDPQKPIYLDGKYHYYYLYNGDYPSGNGTEWRHAVSKDLIHWKDEGVAIPKYTNENGDPWSGSVVVDKNNTAGFGEDAVVAIVTQPSANGKQEQYLWYSTDKGQTFNSYSDEPVMANPGAEDFRDPKIIWDKNTEKWVLLMAEGTKIGFYESENLKDWNYTGGFQTEDIGLVECPDLYMMRADDGTLKWVLGASANGKSIGKPNTYAYWTGEYNGQEFIADNENPKWLDYGFDWYGGVTFADGTSEDKLSYRYALAWMNNWDYANNTPTMNEGFNGLDSIVRKIELKKSEDNTYHLTSQPNENLDKLTKSKDFYEKIEVDGAKTLKSKGTAYQIEADVSWSELENLGLRLRESDDLTRNVNVGISAKGSYSYVNRGSTDQPDDSGDYVESQAPFDGIKKNVHLKILVDKTSIEVFIDDGKVAHSQRIFPPLEDEGITLFSEGGQAVFENVAIKHFQSIHKQNEPDQQTP